MICERRHSGLTCECSSFRFFVQAEDGIRDLVRSRGLGDVYKRQAQDMLFAPQAAGWLPSLAAQACILSSPVQLASMSVSYTHLTLPTSDLV